MAERRRRWLPCRNVSKLFRVLDANVESPEYSNSICPQRQLPFAMFAVLVLRLFLNVHNDL